LAQVRLKSKASFAFPLLSPKHDNKSTQAKRL
jgi:hypothetical protein